MKRFLTLLIISLLCISITPTLASEEVELYSDHAIVIEANTKRILFEKDAYSKAYPASMTKIMTVLLAIENGHLNDLVTVDQASIDAIGYNSSVVPLYAGEKLTLEQLLYGAAVASGNETCYVIGKHISGSVETFVDLMNQKTQEIGTLNTHFENPDGYHHNNHYTTAYDIALIMNECIKNNDFNRYMSQSSYTIEGDNDNYTHKIKGHNILLYKDTPYYLEGVVSSKTGYTTVANCTQVAYFSINNMDYIIVTMDTEEEEERYSDFKTLYNYVLDTYQKTSLESYLNEPLAYDLPAHLKYKEKENRFIIDDTSWLHVKDTIDSPMNYEVSFDEIKKKVDSGSQVGTITFSQDKESITLPIYANGDIVYQIPWYIEIPVYIVVAFYMIRFIARKIYKARKRKLRTQKH